MKPSLPATLAQDGPHTVDTLAARLPFFSREAIAAALEALAAQGVLQRDETSDGTVFHYVAPERYVQIEQDVIRSPGGGALRSRRPARGAGGPAVE
jgi:predicted transcriptional regulator